MILDGWMWFGVFLVWIGGMITGFSTGLWIGMGL